MATLMELQELSIELPITSEMRVVTDQPNRLGAMVLEAYLEMQGVAIERSAGDWRSPLEKAAIADVVLRDLGRVECVVLEDLGDWLGRDERYDRLGCGVVRVGEKMVEILGFLADGEGMGVDDVMSIDDWMIWLDDIMKGLQVVGADLDGILASPGEKAMIVARLNRLYRRVEPWEWRYEGEKVLQRERELVGASREDGMGEGRVDLQDLAERVMERLVTVWGMSE